jgi:hypothetical protein
LRTGFGRWTKYALRVQDDSVEKPAFRSGEDKILAYINKRDTIKIANVEKCLGLIKTGLVLAQQIIRFRYIETAGCLYCHLSKKKHKRVTASLSEQRNRIVVLLARDAFIPLRCTWQSK